MHEMFGTSLSSITDELYEPTEEDEKDYWAGEGHLIFTVISHCPTTSYLPFEIDWEDSSGCIGGLNETLGIEYAINAGILMDPEELRLGFTYEITGITAHFTRGDGWTTDDDVEYYIESVRKYAVLHRWIGAWWWHFIGHRIRNWRQYK